MCPEGHGGLPCGLTAPAARSLALCLKLHFLKLVKLLSPPPLLCSVSAVQLIADVAAASLEVATLQPGMGALAWGPAWAQSRPLAAEGLSVEPWTEAIARSATGGPVLTDTLLVRAAGGEGGGNGSALSLCDVAVLGEPAADLY